MCSNSIALSQLFGDAFGTVGDANFSTFLYCMEMVQSVCIERQLKRSSDSEIGAVMYTIAILLMLSVVIFMLMARTFHSSANAFEFEALLDAMRFREELDIRLRHKGRLMNAKQKVIMWLQRNHGAMELRSSQISTIANKNLIREPHIYVPEIVITPYSSSDERQHAGQEFYRLQSHSSAISMMFNFDDRTTGSRALASPDILINGCRRISITDGREMTGKLTRHSTSALDYFGFQRCGSRDQSLESSKSDSESCTSAASC